MGQAPEEAAIVKDELEQALVRDFPLLYRHPLIDGCFRCDDGWEPLIRKMSAALEEQIKLQQPEFPDLHNEYYDAPSYAEQIKEKYGGLRCYLSAATEEMQRIIDAAERESFFTCEICGKPGRRQEYGSAYWIKTVCLEHQQGK